MHQESLSNHFRSIKRKSAIEAKEKISNNFSTMNVNKLYSREEDLDKPQKIVPQSNLTNLGKRATENYLQNPIKRRSNRNLKDEEIFQIPKNLGNSKKIILEDNINKKRKREEEIVNEIKAAKNSLLNPKNNKNSKFSNAENYAHSNSLSESNSEIELNSLNNYNCQSQKDKKLNSKNNLIFQNANSPPKISENTKAVVKKVLENKTGINVQQVNHNEEIINKNNKVYIEEINHSKGNVLINAKKLVDSRNVSNEKNFMSDDVLDLAEENLKKNKKQKMINEKKSVLLENIDTLRYSKRLQNKGNKNINSCSLNNMNSSIIGEDFSVDNRNIENNTPYKCKKLNNEFSFEKESENQLPINNLNYQSYRAEDMASKVEYEQDHDINNINYNNTPLTEIKGHNLLLSLEANKELKNCKNNTEFKAPYISDKTLSIINKLKAENRQNKFNRLVDSSKERNKSDSSFSLKFKYEDLIKEERELILPPSYKHLFNSYTYLDQTLNFFKISNKSIRIPRLEDLKSSIENTYKQKFDLQTFLQILYVVPHFFIYSWEKTNNNSIMSNNSSATDLKDSYTLFIEIPNDVEERINRKYPSEFNFIEMQTKYNPSSNALSKEILEKRKYIFKNILLEIVNSYHKEFLKEINFSKPFDPYKLKTWHHSFDLESNVPDIPIFEIAERPSIKIKKISDYLNENDFKSNLIKKAIEKCTSKEQPSESQTASTIIYDEFIQPRQLNDSGSKSMLEKVISPGLLSKIKAKELAVKESNSIIAYQTQKSKQKSRLPDLRAFVDKIKFIFIMGKNSSIPISKLCEKIKEGSDTISSADSEDSIKRLICNLSKQFPDLIKIKDHSLLGTLVIIDSKFNVNEVMVHIEKNNLAEEIYN